VTAARAYEVAGPPQPLQEVPVVRVGWEPGLELANRPRVVLASQRVRNASLLDLPFPTGSTSPISSALPAAPCWLNLPTAAELARVGIRRLTRLLKDASRGAFGHEIVYVPKNQLVAKIFVMSMRSHSEPSSNSTQLGRRPHSRYPTFS